MELNEYQRQMFGHFDNQDYLTWYSIDQNRPDRDDLVAAIKLRIDVKNDFEFNDAYTAFRRVYTLDGYVQENFDFNLKLLERHTKNNPLPVRIGKKEDAPVKEVAKKVVKKRK